MQRQLQAAGIELDAGAGVGRRVRRSRSAQAISTRCCRTICRDRTSSGPTCIGTRTAPFNFGHYRNQAVDDALDGIRHAADDDVVQGRRRGVLAGDRRRSAGGVSRLARARARGEHAASPCPPSPTRDVLTTLHLWKPAAEAQRQRPSLNVPGP